MTEVCGDIQLDFSDVLIRPRKTTLSSRKEVVLERFFYQGKINSGYRERAYYVRGIGILNANMGTVGTFEVAKAMLKDGMFATLHKHYSESEIVDFINCKLPAFYLSLIDEKTRAEFDLYPDREHEKIQEFVSRLFITIGTKVGSFQDFESIRQKLDYIPSVCIDVANGYIPDVRRLVGLCRSHSPHSLIMAGNVVTPEVVEELIREGANIVKVGIGPGSACLTRRQTGVGRPQLSTILECAKAAHSVNGFICADGGITCPGDMCKAFAAGADFVMLGGYYAGTDEADGEIIEKCFRTSEYSTYEIYKSNNTVIRMKDEPIYILKKFKKFYGMSSEYAQNKFGDGMPKYRASEGREVEVPYTGPISNRNKELLGGLRSMMTYIDAHDMFDIPKKASFYRVNHQLNTIFGE